MIISVMMIEPSFNQTFAIMEYREFYDVPRCMLTKDGTNAYWVFVSAFDDIVDEYAESYSVYPAGQDEVYARTVLQQGCLNELSVPVCTFPVASLEFHPTKRASFRVVAASLDL